MPLLIPQGISVRPAKELIQAMKVLLKRRFLREISRTQWRAEYKALREELELTPEWGQFYADVVYRSGGRCERDGCMRQAAHVHHKIRISYDPTYAVDPNLSEHLCVPCHQAVDGSHRRWLANAI